MRSIIPDVLNNIVPELDICFIIGLCDLIKCCPVTTSWLNFGAVQFLRCEFAPCRVLLRSNTGDENYVVIAQPYTQYYRRDMR